MRVTPGTRTRRSEKTTQVVAVYAGVAHDARERAALELPMERYDERHRMIGMLESDMTATLAYSDPPNRSQRCDQAFA